MLINRFFQITQGRETETGLLYTITINGDHEIFKGHFPGNSVTPGVVQLQIVKELLEEKYGRSFTLATMSRGKYLKVLDPRSTPQIEVKIDLSAASTPEAPAISASGAFNDDVFFKFNATYR